jgi:hypothetical protein
MGRLKKQLTQRVEVGIDNDSTRRGGRKIRLSKVKYKWRVECTIWYDEIYLHDDLYTKYAITMYVECTILLVLETTRNHPHLHRPFYHLQSPVSGKTLRPALMS